MNHEQREQFRAHLHELIDRYCNRFEEYEVMQERVPVEVLTDKPYREFRPGPEAFVSIRFRTEVRA